jgi:DNA repair exonuclease SbcCD ATPase subunit
MENKTKAELIQELRHAATNIENLERRISDLGVAQEEEKDNFKLRINDLKSGYEQEKRSLGKRVDDLLLEIKDLKEQQEEKDNFKLRINDLKSGYEQEKRSLGKRVDDLLLEIKDLKEQQEERLSKLKEGRKKEIEEAIQRAEGIAAEENKRLVKSNVELERIANFYLNAAKKFADSYGALLKTLQGTTDTHISLNDYMFNEIFKPIMKEEE